MARFNPFSSTRGYANEQEATGEFPYILEGVDDMAKPMRIEQAIDMSSDLAVEGEPHPVELLASLTRADNAGALRPESGTVLTIGEAGETPAQSSLGEAERADGIPAAARALAAPPSAEPEDDPTAMQRTLRVLSSALPLLQRLLPLLDGNVLGAVLNMLTPHGHAAPAQKPADLGPLTGGLAELKNQHRELRVQMQEQGESLKRMADHLQMVREATDRNTLEQQDLIEELKTAGRKMNLVALAAFALLAGSIAVNVYLYIQIHRLLP
jgi:hypothetical protein